MHTRRTARLVMRERPAEPTLPLPPGAVPVAVAVLAVLLVAWSVPAAVTWLHDGTAPAPGAAVRGTVELVKTQDWTNPAAAYSAPLRAHMPRGPVWWAGAGWALATLGALAVGLWRQFDRLASRSTL